MRACRSCTRRALGLQSLSFSYRSIVIISLRRFEFVALWTLRASTRWIRWGTRSSVRRSIIISSKLSRRWGSFSRWSVRLGTWWPIPPVWWNIRASFVSAILNAYRCFSLRSWKALAFAYNIKPLQVMFKLILELIDFDSNLLLIVLV